MRTAHHARTPVAADMLLTGRMRKGRTARPKGRRIALVATGLLATLVAFPGGASAASPVSFRAAVTETFTEAPCFPASSLCVNALGSGYATHLGQIQESASVVSDLSTVVGPGCFAEIRQTTLTAANGDQVTLEATGQNCLTGPTTATAVDTYTVTGGTGRFEGATGSGTIIASVDLASQTAVVTIRGLLSSPGSRQ